MKEREKIMVTGLVTLMLVTWLGFFLHRSPRFAGSPMGGVFAVTGSVLMLVPLLYMFIKRIPGLKRRVTKWASMRTLLTWHVYAGVLGPILVVVHTGHKFESALGVALTAMTLIVVISGFVGRYLMSFIRQEIRALKETLDGLRAELQQFSETAKPPKSFGFMKRVRARAVLAFSTGDDEVPDEIRALQLAGAISDTEYAIASNDWFKRAFSAWLKLHIVLSLVLYALMGFHVWGGLYFGLRWFS